MSRLRLVASSASPTRRANLSTMVTVPIREARVYRDAEWDEYRVRYYREGVRQPTADYHTDDKAEALGVADHFAHSGA